MTDGYPVLVPTIIIPDDTGVGVWVMTSVHRGEGVGDTPAVVCGGSGVTATVGMAVVVVPARSAPGL